MRVCLSERVRLWERMSEGDDEAEDVEDLETAEDAIEGIERLLRALRHLVGDVEEHEEEEGDDAADDDDGDEAVVSLGPPPEDDGVDEAHVGFKALKGKLARKGGVRDPAALAASIGRKKYGAAGMAKKAAAGRRK